MELADVRCLAVLGLGRSGLPAALLARRRLPAARVVALDEGAVPGEAAAQLAEAGVELLTGAAAVLPDGADLLVKSPGVPNESPVVQAALRRGVAVWSEVEFAARFLPNRIAGITGTNGKTTTTELTGALFRDAGLPVAVGGNIGFALAGMPETRAARGGGRRRALQLPARAHRAVPPRRRRPAQPHGGPPGPARRLPRVRGRQAAHLREPAAVGPRRALRRRPGRARGGGGRPSAAAAAAAPGSRPRRGRDAGAGRRAARRRRRRGRRAVAGRRHPAPPAPGPATPRRPRPRRRRGRSASRSARRRSSRCAASTTCRTRSPRRSAACALGVPPASAAQDAAHLRRRASPPAGRRRRRRRHLRQRLQGAPTWTPCSRR